LFYLFKILKGRTKDLGTYDELILSESVLGLKFRNEEENLVGEILDSKKEEEKVRDLCI